MNKRAIITVGLGFGDEGKGATVDFLCRELKADLVVRYSGGSQCGHNVVLPDGRSHCFSQWGSGTLAGVPTYLGRHVIINPIFMANEASHLEEFGIRPYEKLTVHSSCLVATPLAVQINRWREESRGRNRHGSCGHGIGEAREYWLKYGQDAVVAEDLTWRNASTLAAKLELQKYRAMHDESLQDIRHRIRPWSVRSDVESLANSGVMLGVSRYDPDYTLAVFEGAQGVLLDESFGFHPHTTWSTVTARHALEMIPDGTEVFGVGVTRPYMTRHGAGPLPTEAELDITDPNNPPNEWQQSMRFGHFDETLFNYAVDNAGVDIDFLAVNCADHLENVRVLPNQQDKSIDYHVRSTYRKGSFGDWNYIDHGRFSWESRFLEQYAPVGIIGRGPTYQDRELSSEAKRILGVKSEQSQNA